MLNCCAVVLSIYQLILEFDKADKEFSDLVEKGFRLTNITVRIKISLN